MILVNRICLIWMLLILSACSSQLVLSYDEKPSLGSYTSPDKSELLGLSPYPTKNSVCRVVEESSIPTIDPIEGTMVIACPKHEKGAIADLKSLDATPLGHAKHWSLFRVAKSIQAPKSIINECRSDFLNQRRVNDYVRFTIDSEKNGMFFIKSDCDLSKTCKVYYAVVGPDKQVKTERILKVKDFCNAWETDSIDEPASVKRVEPFKTNGRFDRRVIKKYTLNYQNSAHSKESLSLVFTRYYGVQPSKDYTMFHGTSGSGSQSVVSLEFSEVLFWSEFADKPANGESN